MKEFQTSSLFISILLISAFSCQPPKPTLETNATPPLADGWLIQQVNKVSSSGTEITSSGYTPNNWYPAEVPGTVLTTLVNNGIYADPYIGINSIREGVSGGTLSNYIPDLYVKNSQGDSSFYTYWFYNQFNLQLNSNQRAWLRFRGINYDADVYFNGKQVGNQLKGMFLRHYIDLTADMGSDNRLAVLVRPQRALNPGIYGNYRNGGLVGQTGWESVSAKYTVGWDWIAPTRDRNTGIWDKVDIKITGPVTLRNPHIKTSFNDDYSVATVTTSVEVFNATDVQRSGTISYSIEGTSYGTQKGYTLSPGQTSIIELDSIAVQNPQLWWPNGHGAQPLYKFSFSATESNTTTDSLTVNYGFREIKLNVEPYQGINGITCIVNGKKIFIRGGNWVATDAMLRYSPKKYQDEIRFHAQMNLNLIRVWGGGITERPEFYSLCDQYGILVMQDFWSSTEQANDQPDQLYLKNVKDRIKMLRNHASLCFWTGGNELSAYSNPGTINPIVDDSTRCYIEGKNGQPCTGLPLLDGTRTYLSSSVTDGSGPSDGPYGMRSMNNLYDSQGPTPGTPFNPEMGAAGIVTIESIKEMMGNDPNFLTIPTNGTSNNIAWNYHKYEGYNDETGNNQINKYGTPQNLDQYCQQAQLASYEQYKGIFEGYNSRMWSQNSGIVLWKTQNPWPALRSQVYDYYLEQTGGYYGAMQGAQSVNIQLDITSGDNIGIINNTSSMLSNVHIGYKLIDFSGQQSNSTFSIPGVGSNLFQSTQEKVQVPDNFQDVYFVEVWMKYMINNVEDSVGNFYWRSKSNSFNNLRSLSTINIAANIESQQSVGDQYVVSLSCQNPNNVISFWNRIQVLNQNGSRVLPVMYSRNYFSLFPNEKQVFTLTFNKQDVSGSSPSIVITGWNNPNTITLPLSMTENP